MDTITIRQASQWAAAVDKPLPHQTRRNRYGLDDMIGSCGPLTGTVECNDPWGMRHRQPIEWTPDVWDDGVDGPRMVWGPDDIPVWGSASDGMLTLHSDPRQLTGNGSIVLSCTEVDEITGPGQWRTVGDETVETPQRTAERRRIGW